MSSGGALPHCRLPCASGAHTSTYRTRNVAGQVGGCSKSALCVTCCSGPLFNDTLATSVSGSFSGPAGERVGTVHAAGSRKFIESRGLFRSGGEAGAITFALLAYRSADPVRPVAVSEPEIPVVMSLALSPCDRRNTRTAVVLPATRCWLLSWS